MGCATSDGPTVLLIDPSNYAFAFDAAVEAAAADGMKPVLLDRRNGIIVTSPTVAGSLFEPWKSRASSPRQALEDTLALQRRTARFEFKPVNAVTFSSVQQGSLVGPNLLSGSGRDMIENDELIELRVWVYVDRYYAQGIRRGTWSLSSETVSKNVPAEGTWEQTPASFWAPVTRDVASERALLARVEDRIIGR